MSRRVLVILSHPRLAESIVNRGLIESLHGLEGVTINELYTRYPDFKVDVSHEQRELVAHDVIVLQHPFYWYHGPALLKEWLDLVLEYGFAYGSRGKALHGKTLLNAISTGGPREAYEPTGYNHFKMRQLLTPFEQSANLCGMRYLAPFVVHGAREYESVEEMEPVSKAYRAIIEALRDDRINLDHAAKAEYLEL